MPTNSSHKCHFTLVMMVIFSIWAPACISYRLPSNLPQLDHNGRCPGKNEEISWQHCKYGSYIENPDPRNCANRYVCYKGLNEKCRPGVDRCANNAICTHCQVCQKCDSAENCSEFDLCPTAMNIIQRLIQKRLMAINEEEYA